MSYGGYGGYGGRSGGYRLGGRYGPGRDPPGGRNPAGPYQPQGYNNHATMRPETISRDITRQRRTNLFTYVNISETLVSVADSAGAALQQRLQPPQIQTLRAPPPRCRDDTRAINQLLRSWFDIYNSLYFGGGLTMYRDQLHLRDRGMDPGTIAAFRCQQSEERGIYNGSIEINRRAPLEPGTDYVELQWICSLLHEMIHAFFNTYMCLCRSCKSQEHPTQGGRGKTGHGRSWANVMLAAGQSLQDIVGFVVEVGLKTSVMYEMQESNWNPSYDECQRWGLFAQDRVPGGIRRRPRNANDPGADDRGGNAPNVQAPRAREPPPDDRLTPAQRNEVEGRLRRLQGAYEDARRRRQQAEREEDDLRRQLQAPGGTPTPAVPGGRGPPPGRGPQPYGRPSQPPIFIGQRGPPPSRRPSQNLSTADELLAASLQAAEGNTEDDDLSRALAASLLDTGAQTRAAPGPSPVRGPPGRSLEDAEAARRRLQAANDARLAQQLAAESGPQDMEAANEEAIRRLMEEDARLG